MNKASNGAALAHDCKGSAAAQGPERHAGPRVGHCPECQLEDQALSIDLKFNRDISSLVGDRQEIVTNT
jgi:hypothetical protein